MEGILPEEGDPTENKKSTQHGDASSSENRSRPTTISH